MNCTMAVKIEELNRYLKVPEGSSGDSLLEAGRAFIDRYSSLKLITKSDARVLASELRRLSAISLQPNYNT